MEYESYNRFAAHIRMIIIMIDIGQSCHELNCEMATQTRYSEQNITLAKIMHVHVDWVQLSSATRG